MEMPLWRSACAAARDERQQLNDEMARLRAKYRTTISKLADDFIQEESDLRSRMEAFEDRSAILRLSVEPHESSSQPVLKRARNDEMARLRAKYRTTISKLADDFDQEESDLRSRMEAFEDRSAILRLSVEPHESSSQPVLKRACDYEYDFAPEAPERLQPAPVTNDYVFAPVTPERLQPAPTRPPVFANWSEDEVEQPKSLPAEVPRMELEDGVEQPKSFPAEVPAVEFEDEVELPESLWINWIYNEDCVEVELEDGVELIVRATLIGA
jgi:hypothetical protein